MTSGASPAATLSACAPCGGADDFEVVFDVEKQCQQIAQVRRVVDDEHPVRHGQLLTLAAHATARAVGPRVLVTQADAGPTGPIG